MSEPLGVNTTLSHYRIVSKIGAVEWVRCISRRTQNSIAKSR